MCRVLKVSASGYYAWRDRAPSRRAIDNAVLVERIRTIHAESDATYGMPRVRAELIDQGVRISGKRVARLMRINAIRGVSRRRNFVVTTRRDQRQRPAPDLVKREFVADGPNQLWVADMTYVPTWAGFIFLAVVLDVWSRRIVGWAIGEQMTAELVLAALNMALAAKKARGRHPSQRPGQPVHQRRLRRTVQEDGRSPVDGHRRRCLRQRDGRELLRHPRVRADRPAQLADEDRSAAGALHLHRGLVQPAPAPQRARTDLASTSSKGATPRQATAYNRRASNTTCPPSAPAWLAPRRRWTSLRRSSPIRLENQVANRPREGSSPQSAGTKGWASLFQSLQFADMPALTQKRSPYSNPTLYRRSCIARHRVEAQLGLRCVFMHHVD